MFDFISDLKELRQAVALLLKKVTDIETLLHAAIDAEEPEPRPNCALHPASGLVELPEWVKQEIKKEGIK